MRRYLDLLTQADLIRQLQPWFANLGKRQVKAPKIYFRDTGLLHSLLGIGDASALARHPRSGASWEGFALAAAALPSTRDLVLDTNVVLDWLVFGHPVGAPIETALASGQCRWLCTRAMRDELAHVVVRESLARWAIDAPAVLAAVDAFAVEVGDLPPLRAAECLRCTDPDDQVFIDLAIAQRAHALLTRDRAVLRLASRARAFGVQVSTPEAWLRLR